jgi:3-oxoacyl-[acyl-carrier-protein] synthase-1
VASDNIISSLGFTTGENVESIRKGSTGILLHEIDRYSPQPFWASMLNSRELSDRFSEFDRPESYTRFEQMVICSVKDALRSTPLDLADPGTLFILSTTKGNIDLLDHKTGSRFDDNRIYLWNTASLLQQFFRLHHRPMVVSNACISGVLAILVGARLIRSGQYDHIIACGADLVSEFVLSGFNSFLSLCEGPCKPFDRDRQGLSLGEGAGTLILTADPNLAGSHPLIRVGPGFSSNDANHISGPSRTGEGLYIAISRTLGMKEGRRKSEEGGCGIDYISAHGTATPYNDEMESVALTRAGLQNVPVNSYKGYWGHTLGAAGLVESVAGVSCMRHNMHYNTLGFNNPGVTHPIAVIRETQPANTDTFLKIASGFGGCNAALLFYK